MADDDDSERRRAERIPINLEFAAMATGTYISDLSEYGVFVHTAAPAALGSLIRLRFTVVLDDPVIVEAEGRVVRHTVEPTRGMGIEFTQLDPETILRINDVVSRQRPRDSGPPLEQQGDAAAPIATVDEPVDEPGEEDKTTVRPSGPIFTAPPPSPGADPEEEDQKTGLFQSVTEPPPGDSE